MVPSKLRTSTQVAAVVLVVSVVVLVVQLLHPPEIVVATSGSSSDITAIGSYFTYWEVTVVAVAAWLVGVTSTVLVLTSRSQQTTDTASPSSTDGDAPRDGHSQQADGSQGVPLEALVERAERLPDTERVVYEAVLDADGSLPQRDIVDRTDLSKATVSRTLDTLEGKDLLERERRGMGNVVRLRR